VDKPLVQNVLCPAALQLSVPQIPPFGSRRLSINLWTPFPRPALRRMVTAAGPVMAPSRDRDQQRPQQQGEQRLTQATLRQHTDDNPSLPHPTGGRTPAQDESRGSGDGQPAAADPAAPSDAAPADAAEEGAAGGAAAPLERGLLGAVLRAADEGVSVSTGLTPDAPRYSDETLRRPPPSARDAPPEDAPPGSSHAESMAEAADAAVAAVDAEALPAAASSAGTDQRGAGGAAAEQAPEAMTAAERAADEGVSVSTGLGDGASMATDTTFRRGGTTSGRPSFETSLATVSEAGAAGQAARAGMSVSTGLDGAASVASDTTMQSAGAVPATDYSRHTLRCNQRCLNASGMNAQHAASRLTCKHVQWC